MIRFKFTLISVVMALFVSGCATTPLATNAQAVSVIFDNQQLNHECKNLGEIVGSEGNMISYWFIPETKLVTGMMNTLKNQTAQKGGDTVYLRKHVDANTSVTFLAEAYKCSH